MTRLFLYKTRKEVTSNKSESPIFFFLNYHSIVVLIYENIDPCVSVNQPKNREFDDPATNSFYPWDRFCRAASTDNWRTRRYIVFKKKYRESKNPLADGWLIAIMILLWYSAVADRFNGVRRTVHLDMQFYGFWRTSIIDRRADTKVFSTIETHNTGNAAQWKRSFR